MTYNYTENFPIPADLLPARLRALLESVGTAPHQMVQVASRFEHDMSGPEHEYEHMLMTIVPNSGSEIVPLLGVASSGVISFSRPICDVLGGIQNFTPNVEGNDYIIASWGDGSFYTYNLAEKIWMSLGLTPRCVGNNSQHIIYDDLSLPEFGIARGEISNEFYWKQKRNISWTMRNEYLRKYLWMRNSLGVRSFFYEKLMSDSPQLRQLMGGQDSVRFTPENGWYDLDIREHQSGLLIQVWGTVVALTPELCPEQTVEELIWPGIAGPMTKARANALIDSTHVFLRDEFLEKYEQDQNYKCIPENVHGQWWCSPSYLGQWSFSECVRIGRNLIRIPMRELYKPKPDREILHAHSFVLSSAEVNNFDLDEEHIVSKVQRLVEQLLDLGDNFLRLAGLLGIPHLSGEPFGFSRSEIEANGWLNYPQLLRLAQVTPLRMTQQDFLSRSKDLHEIWQKVSNKLLRQILEKAGCPRTSTDEARNLSKFGTLKLLQAITNICVVLNRHEHSYEAFASSVEPVGWSERNASLAYLFVNHDLRIRDAHLSGGDITEGLESLNFDTALLNDGYGRALDYMIDGIIKSFDSINHEINILIER